jgi:hypothetical protein
MVVCAIGTTDDDSIQMPVGIPNLECATSGVTYSSTKLCCLSSQRDLVNQLGSMSQPMKKQKLVGSDRPINYYHSILP